MSPSGQSMLDPSLWASVVGSSMSAGAAKMPETNQPIADIRVEKIENGYLIVYRKAGVGEKRKFARDMNDVGEVTKQVCIELELTPGAK
jgi:hypothetical protein